MLVCAYHVKLYATENIIIPSFANNNRKKKQQQQSFWLYAMSMTCHATSPQAAHKITS